jgi:hypothetical protein
MGVSGQRHATAALYPRGKDPRYPMYRRLGGPQSRSGHRGSRKNLLPPPGIEPRSPGRPARSQTLYWLSYPGSTLTFICYYYNKMIVWSNSVKENYEGESINKVSLSVASTPPFWQLTVCVSIANFIQKLLAVHVQTCSNAVRSSWVHNIYMSAKNVNSPHLLTLPHIMFDFLIRVMRSFELKNGCNPLRASRILGSVFTVPNW